ncbi:hypothetical protein EMIHUDRAFT_124480, partial [Emiliania huxleyi CCMP1516]|uniref:Uncharacterized protein n=2 Tax=Emiliania huxleyi TaxID=2903 RepID=A0A0D3IPU9_EMIH1
RTLQSGWATLRQWEERMRDDILASAEVICSTLIGAGSESLCGRTFSLVVIDEATQATEPRASIALALARGRVVLVGDPQQLPPTTLSEEARRAGLAVSLFERALAAGVAPYLPISPHISPYLPVSPRVAPVVLTTQYRMHPLLAAFSSAAFYRGALTNGADPASRLPPPRWPSRRPLLFVDAAGRRGGERAAPGGVSVLNHTEAHSRGISRGISGNLGKPRGISGNLGESRVRGVSVLHTEARAVADVVARVCGREGGAAPSDVGVVSPYLGQ